MNSELEQAKAMHVEFEQAKARFNEAADGVNMGKKWYIRATDKLHNAKERLNTTEHALRVAKKNLDRTRVTSDEVPDTFSQHDAEAVVAELEAKITKEKMVVAELQEEADSTCSIWKISLEAFEIADQRLKMARSDLSKAWANEPNFEPLFEPVCAWSHASAPNSARGLVSHALSSILGSTYGRKTISIANASLEASPSSTSPHVFQRTSPDSQLRQRRKISRSPRNDDASA